MLEPYIIKRIKEPSIPLYYEPPREREEKREKEDEENTGGTVIEIEI